LAQEVLGERGSGLCTLGPMAAAMRLAVLAAAACGLAAAQVQVDGSGTTNPSKFFWKIMETMQARSRDSLRLTYRAVGSGTGQKEFSQISDTDFTSSLSDFGAGDIPMSNALWTSINAANGGTRKMVHVPFCMGAIALFHSVPADEVGSAGLRLSPCTLAKIMSGQIRTWDHADIMADNPNLNVPTNQQIEVGHRTLGSSSTGGLTGYLEAKCPGDWTLGSASSITWPSAASFHAVEGSPGMTAHIANTPYAIGYLDAGHGHNRNFQEVYLKNEDDNWLTSLQAISTVDTNGENGVAAAGATAVARSATADWSDFNLYGQPGANTWPIVLVSYIYLNKDMTSLSGAKAGLIKAFVDLVTGAEGQGMLADFSFNPLPGSMNTWSTTWSSIIDKPAGVTDYPLLTSTVPWTGMAQPVISSKRNSYSLWKLNELDLAVTTLQSQVAEFSQALSDHGIVPLHGSGTTNPKNWFAKAMKLMESRARVPLFLTYRAVGSSTGQKEFVGDASSNYMSYNAFGAGDIPMSASRFSTLESQTPPQTMVHLPFAMGAIGIFHSVNTETLQLSACLLAKIFSGQITTWDHADVMAENPDLTVPADQTILVAHRNLGSSSTGGVTGYLNQKCPEHWTRGAGSTVIWPALNSVHAVEGSPGMQAYLRDNAYSIGYLDAGHGHDFGLAEVALTNLDGQTRTSRESIALGGVADAGSQGVSQSVFPTDPSADWSAVNLYDMPGANTWPIVLVSYMYVKRDQTATNPKTATALKAFIDVILNNRDSLCQEFGFTEPSTSLRQLSLNAAATITYPPGMVAFTFETSTEPYVGMGSTVISSKRHAYDDYERSVIRDSVQDALASAPAAAPPAAQAPAAEAEHTHSEGLKIAALAISILALLVSICATFGVLKLAK